MDPVEAADPPLDTTRVYWAPFCPCVKPDPTWAFAIVRSGSSPTVTVSVLDVLFDVLLSVHEQATDAVFCKLDAAVRATLTFSVMVEEPLDAIGVDASVQVTA